MGYGYIGVGTKGENEFSNSEAKRYSGQNRYNALTDVLKDATESDTAVFSNMRYSLAWGMGHGAWGMGLPRVPHKPAICCMSELVFGSQLIFDFDDGTAERHTLGRHFSRWTDRGLGKN